MANTLPFSGKPAVESVPRFYTDVHAAGLAAATALWAASWSAPLDKLALAARALLLCSGGDPR